MLPCSTVLLVNVPGLLLGLFASDFTTIPIAHVAHGIAAKTALPDLGRLLAAVAASPDQRAVALVVLAHILMAGTVSFSVPIVWTGVCRLDV